MSSKPQTIEVAVEIVRGHVDMAHRRALASMSHRASGIPSAKPQRQRASEGNVLETLLSVLEDLDPRFGVTQSRLRSESFERIGGYAIVERDRQESRRAVALRSWDFWNPR